MVKGLSNSSSYIVSNTGLNQDEIQDKLTKSKQVVSDNFESNSVTKVASDSLTSPDNIRKIMLLLPPLVAANRLFDGLMGGAESKSLLSKTASVGDKISNVLHLDGVLNDSVFSRISNFIKNNNFTKYFTNDFKAIPKSSIAKGESLTQTYSKKLLDSLSEVKYNPVFTEVIENGTKALKPETIQFIENIGPLKRVITPDYLKSVNTALSDIALNLTNDADKKLVEKLQEQISVILKNQAEGKTLASTRNLADNIASVLGRFIGSDVSSNFSAETSKVLGTVSEKGKRAVVDSIDDIIGVTDDLLAQGVDVVKSGTLTSDPVRLSTLNNKLKAVSSKIGKTKIGQLFAKSSVKTKDLITYGGGLFNLIWTASALINAGKASKEAPKGEKLSTFMHVLSEQYIGILLLQPSTSLLYKIGGNKYRGMSVAGREAFKELVTATNANQNITKEGLKVAKLQSKLLLKGVDKDKVAELAGKGLQEAKTLSKSLSKEGAKLKIWERPLKFLGKILTTGLDTIKKSKYIKLPLVGNVKLPTLKGFAGGFARLIIIMAVIQPFLQKPVTKLCHKIFGEPKAYLAKNKQGSEDKKKPDTQAAQETVTPDAKKQGETNLLKLFSNDDASETLAAATVAEEKAESQPLKPQKGEEAAALSIFNKDKKTDRYIPSINIDTTSSAQSDKELDKQVEQILKESDGFVKKAKKVI